MNEQSSNLGQAVRFVANQWLRVCLISLMILVPAFWHSHVGYGDFPSHVYNAWLAPHIERGELPGLTLARLHTNILTDVVMEWLIRHCGLNPAQHIVLGMSVLTMFWGMFSIVAAFNGRPAWWMTPLFAMLCYGWAYHTGFLNSYLATALCFMIFALLWPQARLADGATAALLIGLVFLAHPLPLAWLLGTLAFAHLSRSIRPSYRWLCLGGGIVVLFVLGRILVTFYSGDWIAVSPLAVSGADQVNIFRRRFFWLSVALALYWLTLLLANARKNGWLRTLNSEALQCYLLAGAAVFFLPVAFVPPGYAQRFGLIADRMSLMAAVLACAALASPPTKRWLRTSPLLLALCFFSFLFTDELQLNRIESKVESLLATLPPGQRVAALLYYPRSRYESHIHALDRACIGRCWSYGNYEASSGQFRTRTTGPNPYVLSNTDAMDDLQHGRYVAQAQDLPLYQIYPCGPKPLDLCIRALQEGERNGAIDRLLHW